MRLRLRRTACTFCTDSAAKDLSQDLRRLRDFTEEARQRPLASEFTRSLGVVEAVLVMDVHDIMLTDRRCTRRLNLLVGPALCQDFGLPKAVAQRLVL